MAAHGGHGGSPLPFFDAISGASHSIPGAHLTARQFIITFIVMLVAFFIIAPQQSLNNFSLLFFFSPLWVPALLYGPTISRFVEANRVAFFAKQDWVLLELKMPRDTTKTPLSMETFFSNIHIGSGEATPYKKYFQGSVRPWWSFEIVSLGGRVHFYIWTRAGYRKTVETFLYAQHPDVEIIEAEDYSRLTDPTDHNYDMWACEYKKTKDDPYPIKSYLEYGLTPGNKPEENVDPLSSLVEFMGSLGPGEELWLQFIIRVAKDEKVRGRVGKNGKPMSNWRDEAADVIKELREGLTMDTKSKDPVTGAETVTARVVNPTKGQGDVINAIEKNVSKQGFDVGIRCLYTAPKDKYQGITVPVMLNLFKSFNNEANNTIGLQTVWSAIFNDYPWEDRKGHHKHHLDHEVTKMYRERMYFYPPYKGDWSVFSTEELATLYHIPASNVTTPNLARTQSTTSSPPTNLPT